jgi:hypothetical protein
MKKLIRFAAPLIAVALFSGASSIYAQAPSGNQNQNPAAEQQDWNTPPPGTEQAQQGYRDGIEAAKLDKLAHRPVDPKVSHLYVHPPVKGAAVADYRTSFENGYKAALKNQGGM